MANSNEYDLMAVGKHCAEEYCKQLDYLPFTCDFCHKDFCLEHKGTKSHSCTEKIDKDSMIPRCPLCQHYILKGVDGQDDNAQVERHIQSGCQDLIMKKRKKNRCSYDRCREVNLIPLHCKKCYQSFCVRHRHTDDHKCSQQQRIVPLLKVR